MRPTNLGFRSPREVSQSPYYNPPVTSHGSSLSYTQPQPQKKQRPKSSQGSRFRDCHPHIAHASVFVGPGSYKDDYKSINNDLKTKIRPKYKGEFIDTSLNSYTYVADSKVLDIAFLSPQGRRPLQQRMKNSMDLTSPKSTPITSLDLFSPNPIITPSLPTYTKTSMNRLEISAKKQPSHQRTQSLQTSGRTKTPAGRKTSTTVNHVFTDYTRTNFTEQDTDKSKRLTTGQKQINNVIYNKILEAQLSPELKMIKRELESFQKKKHVKEIPKTVIRLASLPTEEDEPEKISSLKEKISEKENELEEESLGLPLEKSSKGMASLGKDFGYEEYKILAEASINTQSFRTPHPSLFHNDTLSSNMSSPKFGVKHSESNKFKESSNGLRSSKNGNSTNTRESFNKTRSIPSNSSINGNIAYPPGYPGFPSYGITNNKTIGTASKGIRMI